MRRIFFLFSFLFISSCVDQGVRPHKIEGQTMGTYYRITLLSDHKEIKIKELHQDVEKYLADFDKEFSNYREDSTIKLLNATKQNNELLLSSLFSDLLKKSKEMSILTQGNFDISIYPVVLTWGFGGAKKRETEPTEDEIRKAMSAVGMSNIIFSTENKVRKQKSETMIDVNGIAPGFAVDELSDLLRKKGFPHHLIDIGGEVRGQGKKPDNTWWQVGVETPREHADLGEAVMKVITLKNKSLATSGNYRSFYKIKGRKYGHTISPKTGRPVEHNLASVTVVSDNCYQADAWATALMVMGPEQGYKFSLDKKLMAYFIIYEQGQFVTKITPELETYLQGNK